MNLELEINELWLLKQKEYDSLNRIKLFIQTQAEANRKYYFGEIVSVYNDMNEYVCDGVVGNVRTSIFINDGLDISNYARNNDKIYIDLGVLQYEVFAKTKDGKSSKKHVMGTQHMFLSFEDIKKWHYSGYIKPKNI